MNSTVLTIEKEQGKYAKSIASKLNASIGRKKGMIDLLGVTLFAKFMKKQHINLNLKNCLHKFPFALEDYKIADVSYNGYKLFVVTVFNENYIRIPKLHFELGIQPDFYVITEVNKTIEKGAIGGFIAPDDVLGTPGDDKFYYPAKRDISKIEDLIEILKIARPLRKTYGKHLEASAMFAKLIDGELPKQAKDKLVRHLMTCESCTIKLRDLIQFDSALGPAEYFTKALGNYNDGITQINPNVVTVPEPARGPVSARSGQKSARDAVQMQIERVAAKALQANTDADVDIDAALPPITTVPDAFQSLEDASTIEFLKKKLAGKKEAIDLMFKSKNLGVFEFLDFSKINIKDLDKKKKIIITAGVAGLLLFLCITGAFVKKAHNDRPIEVVDAIESLDYGDVSFYDEKYSQAYFESQSGIGLDYNLSSISGGKSSVSGVRDISWEVDNDTAGKEDYTKFLQIVGKNIKLSLQNELLLTSDFPRNHTVKAEIKFAGNGNVGSLKMLQGSGSRQIDEMIQKCIYETLSYIKPPKPGFMGKNPSVTLVIEL